MKEIERLAEEAMRNHRRGFTVEWPVAPEDLESAYETLMTQYFNLVEQFKELEATHSPRPIEEAPEEWFDGRSVLVWDDEYERTFIGMFVSPLGWVVDERGLDSLTQLHCVTKVLPLPSMDGGEK